jgi:hypothetical protein
LTGDDNIRNGVSQELVNDCTDDECPIFIQSGYSANSSP